MSNKNPFIFFQDLEVNFNFLNDAYLLEQFQKGKNESEALENLIHSMNNSGDKKNAVKTNAQQKVLLGALVNMQFSKSLKIINDTIFEYSDEKKKKEYLQNVQRQLIFYRKNFEPLSQKMDFFKLITDGLEKLFEDLANLYPSEFKRKLKNDPRPNNEKIICNGDVKSLSQLFSNLIEIVKTPKGKPFIEARPEVVANIIKNSFSVLGKEDYEEGTVLKYVNPDTKNRDAKRNNVSLDKVLKNIPHQK